MNIDVLVNEYISGNTEVFNKILAHYEHTIKGSVQARFNLGQRFQGYGREDLEQQLRIILYNSLLNYDPTKGAAFTTYFISGINNEWKRLSKQNSRKMRNDLPLYIEDMKVSSEEGSETVDIPDFSSIAEMHNSELEVVIHSHSRMSKQEKVYCLLIMEGLDVTTIASRMGVSRQRVSTIANKLREKCNNGVYKLLPSSI